MEDNTIIEIYMNDSFSSYAGSIELIDNIYISTGQIGEGWDFKTINEVLKWLIDVNEIDLSKCIIYWNRVEN